MFRSSLPLAVLLATSCLAARAAEPITIGFAGPLTGSNAAFGAQMHEGADQAIADINAAGGVLGRKLVLETGDDACEPRQAVSVANDLVGQGVPLVVGHFCSSSSIPASKVYAEEGVLEITPGSTNPALTDTAGWNVFRTCGRDDQQGRAAGAGIAARFPHAKVAVLNDNSAYGKGLADQTERALRAAGDVPALVEAYVPGERDYTALVSRMKADGIGVIYIGGYPAEAGLITRQAHDQGLQAVTIGGDALVTSEYWGITGLAGEGTLMTFAADPRRRPEAAKVVAEFTARHVDPEGYVLYTYAAVQEWAAAVAKAGTTDPHRVATTLRDGGPWQTVVGPISYDAKGDVRDAAYVFYAWHDGQYAQQ